jgi:lysophospholipase L1-like esterase
LGRVDARDPNAAVFAWQGAGVAAKLSGTSLAVRLRTDGTDTVFFQAWIDGTKGPRFEVRSGAERTVTLASGLVAGDHDVALYRETEGAFGQSTFLGFSSGALRAPPAASSRLIEVVGDSISAAYGNLGEEPHPAPAWVANPACHWTAANSSWFESYAAIAGRELNAEVSTIARSGWGMVRDRTNDTTRVLSSVYDNAAGTSPSPAWSFSRQASAVVINLGTNDWNLGDPGTAYETAYLQFIAHVRTRYPAAWILLTIGPMLGEPALSQVKVRLAAVVAARTGQGDSRVATFDFGMQNLGADGLIPTGCDWHPSRAEHARMAQILKSQLQSKLGW